MLESTTLGLSVFWRFCHKTPGRLIPGQICRAMECLSQCRGKRTLVQSTPSHSRLTQRAQSFVSKAYIPCSNPIAESAANQLAFFSADDLIRYGADGAFLAPCTDCIRTPLKAATSRCDKVLWTQTRASRRFPVLCNAVRVILARRTLT